MQQISEHSSGQFRMSAYELLQRRGLDLQQPQLFATNGRITGAVQLAVMKGLQQTNVTEICRAADHDVQTRHFVARSIVDV
jgi:hypothetical protein